MPSLKVLVVLAVVLSAPMLQAGDDGAAQLGKNFVDCARGVESCNLLLLTAEQAATVASIKAQRLTSAAADIQRITPPWEAEADAAWHKELERESKRADRRRTGKAYPPKKGFLTQIIIGLGEGALAINANNAAHPRPVPVAIRAGSVQPAPVDCFGGFTCNYGEKCVKPAGSYAMNGICVQPIDEFGHKIVPLGAASTGLDVVQGCGLAFGDCESGFECTKQPGQMVGLCTKPGQP